MDFELKSFEDKINGITEQFMSLLDSKEVASEEVTNKFENTAINFEKKFDITPENVVPNGTTSDYGIGNPYQGGNIEDKKVGGIAFADVNPTGNTPTNETNTPNYAIKFDNSGYADLNRRLEELYQEKKSVSYEVPTEHASIAFSDSNLAAFNSYSYNVNSYTNDKTNSGNEKEGYNMANYGFTESDDNSIFSFATVPQERALTARRGFSDVLFMDIPWDTKIDIWGGIKSLFETEVRFTF